MNRYLLIFTLCLVACTSRSDPIQIEITMQQKKVASAKRMVDQEATRLQVMEDSFKVKVRQNLVLGIPKKKADVIERMLVQTQQAVVDAAGMNLKRQQEHLEQLKKHAKSP
ncbi:MAG: hypothetical protein O7G87_07585 [bacterium]|nr:hypothetical protein [bacterium]